MGWAKKIREYHDELPGITLNLERRNSVELYDMLLNDEADIAINNRNKIEDYSGLNMKIPCT